MKTLINRKGFTLIELIVVIAIIAILAVIIIPRFSGFTDSAREKSVLSDARNIQLAVEALAAQGYTFNDTDSIDVISPGEIMTYLGKATGGQLSFSSNDGSFNYQKDEGDKRYKATYEFSSGEITMASLTAYETLSETNMKVDPID